MTKKQIILDTALELFAEYGFHAVSTARIAKEAGVSEGLIFKHYKNKQELLNTIYFQLDEKIKEMYAGLFIQKEPEKVVEAFINIASEIKIEEYPFWKLIFKLKWNDDFYKPEETQPIIDRLSWALKGMNFDKPKEEAELLVHSVENIFISILRDGLGPNKKLLEYLKKKYQNEVI